MSRTSFAVICLYLACAHAQSSFPTPEDAGREFLAAAERNDVATLNQILGAEGADLVASGDSVQDRFLRQAFARKAKEMFRAQIDPMDPSHAFLVVGAEQEPFAIPLARDSRGWHFDTKAGHKELLARRIGSNELEAIATCLAYYDAQRDYSQLDPDRTGIAQYAQKFISTPGKKDGLYWPTRAEGPISSIAIRVKRAMAEGYSTPSGDTTVHHGYRFRILRAQGGHARGGAHDYVHNNLMIGGFAMVAAPVEYGVSGIKTFLINQDGVVYEKDQGPKTTAATERMTKFDPDKTWETVR